METKTLLWVIIGILFLAVIYLVFRNSQLGSAQITGNVIDTSGWTDNEKMQYDHHGTLPARLQGNNVQQQGAGMVCGC